MWYCCPWESFLSARASLVAPSGVSGLGGFLRFVCLVRTPQPLPKHPQATQWLGNLGVTSRGRLGLYQSLAWPYQLGIHSTYLPRNSFFKITQEEQDCGVLISVLCPLYSSVPGSRPASLSLSLGSGNILEFSMGTPFPVFFLHCRVLIVEPITFPWQAHPQRSVGFGNSPN